MRTFRWLVAFSLLVACDPAGGTLDAAIVDAGGDANLPPRMCRSGHGWDPGMPAFEDRTDAWGLGGLNGNNLGVADIDGDGFSDLVVNAGSAYDRTSGHVFLNGPNGPGRRFVDHSAASHLYDVRGTGEPGRSVNLVRFGDLDDDGDVDAFTGTFMYLTDPTRTALDDRSEVLLNDGHGVFTLVDRTVTTSNPEFPLLSDAFFFDQDLDGRLDLALGYWWEQPPFMAPYGDQPQLFRGDGTGAFTDATDDVGMRLGEDPDAFFAGTSRRPLFGLVMCDVNDDGRMDMAGAAYGRMFNELFVADGSSFTEIGAQTLVGEDDRRDFTDDESFRCYCVDHPTAEHCAGLPAPRYTCPVRGWRPGSSDDPTALGGNTFSYACADFDNDGDLDLYESNIRHPDVGSASDPSELIVNESTPGNLLFTRPGRETMGLTPPIDLTATDEGGQHDAAFDFDADGRMDIYLAGSPYPDNRGWLFHQQREGTLQFEYIGAGAGFDHACPNGSAIADFDHDGDLDIVVGTYGCNGEGGDWSPPELQPIRFYENVSTDANWLAIRLVGRGAGGANRQGIGARIRVTAGGVTQTMLMRTSSQNAVFEAEAFVGLGESCEVDAIEVRWPDGALTTTTYTNVVANYRIELREGDPSVTYDR
jgi:hypothetical protein